MTFTKPTKGGVGAAESRKIPLKVMKFLFDVFCTLYESFNNVNKVPGENEARQE